MNVSLTPLDLAQIPPELRARPQWVVWRSETRDGKPTKVPYRAGAPAIHASTTDPGTWATFAEAEAVALRGEVDGIGFVFAPDDPYFGIDVDDLDDADRDWIVETLDSYTERSVSRSGLHVIARGKLNGRGRHPAEFGIFDSGRYFVMTGQVLGGRTTIRDRQAQLDAVLARFLPAPPKVERSRPAELVDVDDRELFDRALRAANGAQFDRLWHGDTSGYPSRSEADLALVGMIAFWIGPDPARIDEWFRRSELFRDKWERADYRAATIERALRGRTEFYVPRRREPARAEPAAETAAEPTVASDDRADPTVTFAEFVARADATRDPIVTGEQGTMLPAGGLAILAAKTGDGKTTLTVEFAQHAAAGRDYQGLSFPRPLNVLVIENEGPREAFRAKLALRLEVWEHGGDPRIWDIPAAWGEVRISNPVIREQLHNVAATHKTDLVISDSLTRFGVRGNGTPEETREFVEWLTELGLGRDLAFLLLHHPRTRSDPGEDELERIAGAWPPHADLIMLLKRLDGDRARLSFPKTRWASGQRPPCILAFDTGTQSFEYVGVDEREQRDYLAELTELMRDGDWWSGNMLRKSKEQGGIGAHLDAIVPALADARFESAKGDDIGKRKDSTYYRLREASRGSGDGRDARTLWPEEDEASRRPALERDDVGRDASSGPHARQADGHDDDDLDDGETPDA